MSWHRSEWRPLTGRTGPDRAPDRRVLHAEADSAAEALIFPPDGGQARASGRNRPNVPCSDIADVGSAEFNVCLWRRQSTVLLSQRDRSICSWWPAPLAVAEGASATDPADRPERRCEAISSAARRTWRIRKLVGGDQRERRPRRDHPTRCRRLGYGDVGGQAGRAPGHQQRPGQHTAAVTRTRLPRGRSGRLDRLVSGFR